MRVGGEDRLELVEEDVANQSGVWLADLRNRQDV
jgi:hypothetical protein